MAPEKSDEVFGKEIHRNRKLVDNRKAKKKLNRKSIKNRKVKISSDVKFNFEKIKSDASEEKNNRKQFLKSFFV